MSTNKYVTITPNVVTLLEYATFTQTFTINYDTTTATTNGDPSTYDFVFHDVIVTEAGLSQQSSIITRRLTDLTFTQEGYFSDVFDRVLKYVDINNQKGVVYHFGDMPATFGGLYSYTPPSVDSKAFTFTLRMRPTGGPTFNPPEISLDTYPLNYIIINNRSNDSAHFLQALQGGVFYQQALSKGYAE